MNIKGNSAGESGNEVQSSNSTKVKSIFSTYRHIGNRNGGTAEALRATEWLKSRRGIMSVPLTDIASGYFFRAARPRGLSRSLRDSGELCFVAGIEPFKYGSAWQRQHSQISPLNVSF